MTHEMEAAVSRLQTLPEGAQGELAPHLNASLNKLNELRAEIQSGIESGNAGPLDMREIIEAARQERDAEQTS